MFYGDAAAGPISSANECSSAQTKHGIPFIFICNDCDMHVVCVCVLTFSHNTSYELKDGAATPDRSSRYCTDCTSGLIDDARGSESREHQTNLFLLVMVMVVLKR